MRSAAANPTPWPFLLSLWRRSSISFLIKVYLQSSELLLMPLDAPPHIVNRLLKQRDQFVVLQLTVTGVSTLWTLLSSTKISIAFMHRALTSASFSGSHLLSCSIWRSKSDDIRAYSQSNTSRSIANTAPKCDYVYVVKTVEYCLEDNPNSKTLDNTAEITRLLLPSYRWTTGMWCAQLLDGWLVLEPFVHHNHWSPCDALEQTFINTCFYSIL